MGCNVNCLWVFNDYYEDWGLDDLSGKGIEVFRVIREFIKIKVIEFINFVKNE